MESTVIVEYEGGDEEEEDNGKEGVMKKHKGDGKDSGTV